MYHQTRHTSSPSLKADGTRAYRAPYKSAFLTALLLAGTCLIPAQASPAHLTSQGNSENQANLVSQSVSDRFDSIPSGKVLHRRPSDVKIYEFDSEPLGERSPFLMVHGLRGEYWPYFRWQKVADHLNKSPEFSRKYKIYMVRYSSLDRMEVVLPKFKEAFNHLYALGKNRPISMMALSMGGNLSYEAFTDKDIQSKVHMLFTMGTPFHGSPLFCKEWMAYTLYKRLSWPWSRIDHSLALNLYFRNNACLRQDLTWDNADACIPDPGHFWSKLPFGPSGRLTAESTTNERLVKVNSAPADRSKLITYGGYIVNPYLAPRAKRYLESAFMYPYFLISTTFPAHMAREHPVLDMLNRDIANVQVPKKIAKTAGSPFIYCLNDGITPVTSAIFLPPDVAKQHYLASEPEVEKVKDLVNVGQARVFRNVDHLTFIDGIRPLNPIKAAVSAHVIRDELNPQDGTNDMFDWILGDILRHDATTSQLAKEIKTPSDKDLETEAKAQ